MKPDKIMSREPKTEAARKLKRALDGGMKVEDGDAGWDGVSNRRKYRAVPIEISDEKPPQAMDPLERRRIEETRPTPIDHDALLARNARLDDDRVAQGLDWLAKPTR